MPELFIILSFINLEIEVGAVIVDNLSVPFLDGRAVLEEAALDVVGFFSYYRQRTVNIMQFKRWFSWLDPSLDDTK